MPPIYTNRWHIPTIANSNHTERNCVHCHIICLPQTKAGNTNMLLLIDYATLYVIATPSASLTPYTVTDEAFYHNIILRYGRLSMYLSDRGTAPIARHTEQFLQK
ncbi:hypothetical protein NPIL_81891 [Nephila pilipes]|uniref:Uncharacterized protein n=1 Tax=Nephila pilipes TaxID=299642 RepID=A0A8X6NMB6_NEPPI|nr:hypothetical protein NPIL_81891 [Nephila pilipes]